MKLQLKQEIGARMRKVRKSLGLTQIQIVTHFPIGRANYSRIEKGEIFPGAEILNTLHSKFDISLDWLLTGSGDMYTRQTPEEPEAVEESITLGDYPDEMKDLLLHMNGVPMVKHAVLGFFIEYKTRNKNFIAPLMQPDQENQL